MKRTLTLSLDTDWIWRVLLFGLGERLLKAGAVIGRWLGSVLDATRRGPGARLVALLGADGAMGRTWQIGTTALWIAVLLTTYVLLYYL